MGFWNTVASVTNNTKLDRLCKELGWPIDFRKGHVIGLDFNGDHITPRRTVVIGHEAGVPIMSFSCRCRAEFSGHDVPENLLAVLLLRNDDVSLGAWAARVDDGSLILILQYTALADGVDAANFKMICNLMLKEVAETEAKPHRKGLL